MIQHLLSSPDVCVIAFRNVGGSFILFAALVAGTYPLSRRYFGAAENERERKFRILSFFGSLFSALFTFHSALFLYTCSLPTHCGRMFDLNCNGIAPVLYGALTAAGAIATVVLVTREVVRHRRRRA